ncbi:DUF402 domain-containing protein [Calidifontibacter terrae]
MTAEPTSSSPIGTPVHLDFRKYDDREHWQEHYHLLGVDEVGVWLGMAQGVSFARPGVNVVAKSDTVRLLPHGALWAACFNAPGPDVTISTYVDITTPVRWTRTPDGLRATLEDIDLDVIERPSGEIYIDDEDEFADHTVEFGYPPELVAATRQAADEVFAMVQSHVAPFDGSGAGWLARVIH